MKSFPTHRKGNYMMNTENKVFKVVEHPEEGASEIFLICSEGAGKKKQAREKESQSSWN